MSEIWVLFLIAIGLAVDCFTVSLCIGASPRPFTPGSVFRLSYHFGLFQGGMAFLGWALGASLAQYIASLDHWIALLLLLWVGGKMIREGVSKEDPAPEADCEDRTRGASLVMLSIATSIDAFGVGLSLALIDADGGSDSADRNRERERRPVSQPGARDREGHGTAFRHPGLHRR